jgi:hypothetical protein
VEHLTLSTNPSVLSEKQVGPRNMMSSLLVPASRHKVAYKVTVALSNAALDDREDARTTREWCRREMIEAKLFNVPLVVANCIKDTDERGFPYMANVPIVRMDPEKRDRIDVIVARLMDEVLKDFLWRCRVRIFATVGTNVCFLPRPPELIVLTAFKSKKPPSDILVYPDPPIGAEEMLLFESAAPGMKLLSATEWLAGVRS